MGVAEAFDPGQRNKIGQVGSGFLPVTPWVSSGCSGFISQSHKSCSDVGYLAAIMMSRHSANRDRMIFYMGNKNTSDSHVRLDEQDGTKCANSLIARNSGAKTHLQSMLGKSLSIPAIATICNTGGSNGPTHSKTKFQYSYIILFFA